MLENVKLKLLLDESVLSTLPRGGEGQNVYRMIFSNPCDQGCSCIKSFSLCANQYSLLLFSLRASVVRGMGPLVSVQQSSRRGHSCSAANFPLLALFHNVLRLLEEGDIGGFWTPQYRKKNSANTAIPQKKSPNTATPHYQVQTRCNAEISTLYVKLSVNNTEITIKSLLMNVKFSLRTTAASHSLPLLRAKR